jgi:hypothetical protein
MVKLHCPVLPGSEPHGPNVSVEYELPLYEAYSDLTLPPPGSGTPNASSVNVSFVVERIVSVPDWHRPRNVMDGAL